MPESPRPIIIFGLVSKHPGRNRGGTAISMGRLANFFARSGHAVYIVMRRPKPGHFLLDAVDPAVRFRFLHARSRVGIFFEFLKFLFQLGTCSVLALDVRACQIASWLAAVPMTGVRVWASFHSALPENRKRLLKNIAARCDGVIAISHGLAADFARLTSAPDCKVHVIHNLVVTPELLEAADEPVDHPWFRRWDVPVLLGVGRLMPEKGFDVLLRAFAQVRRLRCVRLAVLGEGPQADALLREAQELGIAGDFALLGFQRNPWAFMKRASMVVSASRSDAFGNVLAEALALGVPVVAADCPHGPREILDGGRLGRLVPVGDEVALAEAIIQTLDDPLPSEVLTAGAARFGCEYAGRRYLHVMGLG
ncbi:MAG: glycosyltransferase [Deltaproteobacteria bacterium]